MDSPALQACLDVPILERQGDAYVEQAVRKTGRRQVHSHFGGEFERGEGGGVRQRQYEFDRPPVNYPVFIRALKETGYDGYFCYEYCHPAQNDRHETEGLEFVAEQTRLAFAYLRDLLVAEGAYTGRGAPAAR